MEPYSAIIEHQMQRFYQSLTEKEQRRYAALEALKLGHGGKRYIRALFGCDYKTQTRGLRDLQNETAMKLPRIRQKGGGRKKNRRHPARHQGAVSSRDSRPYGRIANRCDGEMDEPVSGATR